MEATTPPPEPRRWILRKGLWRVWGENMAHQLIGREVELSALVRAIEAAHRGEGRIVLLSGEAGIGKSRLAAQGAALAEERGFTVLKGQAHALTTGLAYAPVVEALRLHLAGLGDDRSRHLLADLPDLGRLLPDPRLPAPPPLGDPKLERTRMFEAVCRLVERLAERAPVLLFIDDLHWADPGTIELVHYVGRAAARQRVLVLASYRAGVADGPLNELAVAVRRHQPDDGLRLAPLSDAAVAELVRDLLSADPAPDLLRGVTTRAKGVPLFVTALVEVGGAAPRPDVLPAIVRDVVLERLHRLDEHERRLLEIVSVAEGTGSREVLRAVWAAAGPAGAADFDRALRRLVTGGLVAEHQAGPALRYQLAHPLYAEVAYAELTAGERRGLHAAVAAAVDRLEPDNVLVLAPHYRDAGDLVDAVRAVDVLAAAGWRALGVHAADEAVQYLGAALERAHAAGRTDLIPPLLDGLGKAYQGSGRLDDAAAAWTEALALAQAAGETARLPRLRNRLALLESVRGNFALADRHREAGIRAMANDEPQTAIVRLVFALRHGDMATLRDVAVDMTKPGEQGASPSWLSVADQGRSVLAMLDDDFATARQAMLRALAHAEQCAGESPEVVHTARRLSAPLSIMDGDMAAALELAKTQRAERSEFALPAAHASAQVNLALVHYICGDLDAAMAAMDVSAVLGRRMGLDRTCGRVLAVFAFLLAERGKVEQAAQVLADANGMQVREYATEQAIELAEIALAIHSDHPEQAPPLTERDRFQDPVIRCLRYVFAGHASIAAGDHRAAEWAAGRLRQLGTRAPFADALADRVDGLLAVTRDEVEPGRTLLRSAAERLAVMGAHLLSAQARLEWARLATADDARATLPQCLAVLERSGATSWLDRGRQLARSVGLRVPTTRETGPLSNRQMQVVRLVSEGLSNAAIAARLFLSERTVETHLRNSYARLGLDSRVALARWAAEHGTT